MAATDEMVRIACEVRPADCCLVPEHRAEVTTEGGLDAAAQVAALGPVCRRLADAGIRVSLFVDPDPPQLDAAVRIGAPAVELHTGAYADARGEQQARELQAHPRGGASREQPRADRACRARHELSQRAADRRDPAISSS